MKTVKNERPQMFLLTDELTDFLYPKVLEWLNQTIENPTFNEVEQGIIRDSLLKSIGYMNSSENCYMISLNNIENGYRLAHRFDVRLFLEGLELPINANLVNILDKSWEYLNQLFLEIEKKWFQDSNLVIDYEIGDTIEWDAHIDTFRDIVVGIDCERGFYLVQTYLGKNPIKVPLEKVISGKKKNERASK